MTTPPHIEAIARAILKMDGSRSDREVDLMRDNGSFVYKYTVKEATLAFSMSAEICAEVCENWSDAQHIAHDMRTGVFPKQTKVWNAIACRIRALITKEE